MFSNLPKALRNPYVIPPLSNRIEYPVIPGEPQFVITDDSLYVTTDDGEYVITG
jgi:hypothetical protein